MNLGDFINATLNKAGVQTDDPALKELVTKVATMEISDELVTKFNQSYITMEAAKNGNPTLKSHYFAQAYNGLDHELEGLFTELELPDDVKQQILSEKGSTKRAAALTRKVKELEAAKASASTKGDKADLAKQIEALNKQILDEKANAQKAIEEKEKHYKEQLSDFMLVNTLAGYKYASDLAKEENFMLPKMKILNELKAKGLRVVPNENTLKLEREDGTDFYDNNEKVDYKSFAEKVLAQHKLLEVSGGSDPAPKQPVTVVTGGNGGLRNDKFLNRIEELEKQQQQS